MRRSLTLSAVPLTKLLRVSVCFVGGLGHSSDGETSSGRTTESLDKRTQRMPPFSPEQFLEKSLDFFCY